MALTTDFTGSYNWAEEEARGEANRIIYLISEGEDDKYIQSLIAKIAAHWRKVFDNDADDCADFEAAFNAIMPSEKYYL